MHTQTHKSHHVANNAIRSALVAAQKEKAEMCLRRNPEKISTQKLRKFCADNNVPVYGDRRFKKTFVLAVREFFKKAATKSVNVAHVATPVCESKSKRVKVKVPNARKKTIVPASTDACDSANGYNGYSYPANLIEKGDSGKYCFFRNRESEVSVRLVVNEYGKRHVHVLLATGNLSYLTKGNVHEKWYVPYIALRRGKFDAPKWMSDEQRRWVVSVIKELRDLHELFLFRVNRKRNPEVSRSRPKQLGGFKRKG